MPVVSRVKRHIIQPDTSYEECDVIVSVDSDGLFSIPLPQHIADVVSTLPAYKDGKITRLIGSEKKGWTMCAIAMNKEEATRNFADIERSYTAWLRGIKGKQFIAVTFKSNVRHIDGFHNAKEGRTKFVGYGSYRGDISFEGSPALSIHSRSLWKIGDDWFIKKDNGQFSKTREENGERMLPYTPERQEFFDGVELGLSNLICQITEFFEDMEGNTDRAIASGMQFIGLPAPVESPEDFPCPDCGLTTNDGDCSACDEAYQADSIARLLESEGQ